MLAKKLVFSVLEDCYSFSLKLVDGGDAHLNVLVQKGHHTSVRPCINFI